MYHYHYLSIHNTHTYTFGAWLKIIIINNYYYLSFIACHAAACYRFSVNVTHMYTWCDRSERKQGKYDNSTHVNMIMDLIGRAKWIYIYLRHYQYDAHRNASFSICIFIASPSFTLHLLIIFVLSISLFCFHFIQLNEDFVCYHMTLIIMCVHFANVCVYRVARSYIIICCSSFSHAH